MLKISLSLFYVFFILFGYGEKQERAATKVKPKIQNSTNALAADGPPELEITNFTGPDITPSPACLAVAPTGEVFVGVDMMGSLGKAPGKGSIVKLVDSNNDGKVDAADYVVWRKGGTLQNETISPGTNTAADYTPYRVNYGATSVGSGANFGSGTPVPEPGTALLSLASGFCLICVYFCRRIRGNLS